MNSHIFNASLLAGWGMAVVGGCLFNLAAGLVGGGLLLLIMAAFVARIAGIYISKGDA